MWKHAFFSSVWYLTFFVIICEIYYQFLSKNFFYTNFFSMYIYTARIIFTPHVLYKSHHTNSPPCKIVQSSHETCCDVLASLTWWTEFYELVLFNDVKKTLELMSYPYESELNDSVRAVSEHMLLQTYRPIFRCCLWKAKFMREVVLLFCETNFFESGLVQWIFKLFLYHVFLYLNLFCKCFNN